MRAAFEGTLERVSVHGGSVIHSAQVSNLSVGGCFVRGIEPVPVGELLHLRLHLPAAGWTVASGVRENHSGDEQDSQVEFRI